MEKAVIKYKNWGQLPICKYWELREVLDHVDEYEGLDANIAILSVLTDVDEDTLLDMSIFDIEQLMSQAKYVFTKVPIHHVGYRHIVPVWLIASQVTFTSPTFKKRSSSFSPSQAKLFTLKELCGK